MDNHDMIPVTMTKRIWNLVRVIFQLARKGISSKRKLFLELNLLLKRGKMAGKALVVSLKHPSLSTKGEYEFNCSDTPAHHAVFNFLRHHRKRNKNRQIDDVAAAGLDGCPEFFINDENYEAVNRVLNTLAIREIDQPDASGSLSSSSSLNYYYSPVPYNLPGQGFDRSSPKVRKLRVTDSPYPLANNIEDYRHVDKAAEEFINRFYTQLRQQIRLTPASHGANY